MEYLSKRLNSAEVNYSVTEREFVGLLQGLRTWRHYLIGRKVVVRTDHASLQYLMSQPALSRRQTRWLEFLGQFDLEIVHVPGKLHAVPDALSRRPDLDPSAIQAAVTVQVQDTLLAEIRQAQQQATGQDWLQQRQWALTGERSFCMHEGLVCRKRGHHGQSIVIPTVELQSKLVELYHTSAMRGHLGTYRLVKVLSERYYWKGLHATVRKFVRECSVCQQAKVETKAPLGQL